MAKMVFGIGLGDYAWLEDSFAWELTLKSSSATTATLEDSTGSTIVLTGTGLTFTGDDLTAGNVTGVAMIGAGGEELVTITEGNYTAADFAADDFWDFVSALSAGDDTFIGNDLGTDLNSLGDNDGDDTLIAGDGGSYMAASRGKDDYQGGSDWDTLSYENAIWQTGIKKGVTINAAKGTAVDYWGDKDTFSEINELRGTHLADKIKGSAGEDAFAGMDGKDKIDGGKGWDELRYHRDQGYDGGDHGIVANLAKGTVKDGFGDVDKVKNIEAVYGTYFNDSFVGNAQDNEFRGISGVDKFNGGGGSDIVSFDWWEDLGQHGVDVDMTRASGQIIDDGFGNTETMISIENIRGSNLADTIRLGADDTHAWGNGGDDTLIAGDGVQEFYGGDGADTFVFETLSSLGLKPERDYIDDFSSAEGDRLDLSGVGGLVFKGTGAFGGDTGELRVGEQDGYVTLSGDTDGDTVADFQIIFGGSPTITGADLIL